VRDYPLPAAGGSVDEIPIDDETRKRLASLGYVSSPLRAAPSLREDAPRPADMTELFPALDRASALFVRGEYAAAIPLFERILEHDPANLAALLRLAVAHSSLGHEPAALAAFERAGRLRPESADVRHYLAMHLVRSGHLDDAAPLLEGVLADSPNRLPALEALARIRAEQGHIEEARDLLRRVIATKPEPAAELLRLGELSMAAGDTPAAIDAFKQAQRLLGDDFDRHLELGVCYLAARRLEAARDALDRVPPSHRGRAMALFKRAQVSVLLGEPDRAARIRHAYEAADDTTAPLIEREPLFRDVPLR
jgi:tetratricopeptide (TPR) repeat protein